MLKLCGGKLNQMLKYWGTKLNTNSGVTQSDVRIKAIKSDANIQQMLKVAGKIRC